MELVVNSWFAYYFKPFESAENKQLLEQFLEKFSTKNDVLVILEEGEMNTRLREISKMLIGYPAHLKIMKKFFREIYIEPSKCRIVSGNVDLPENIENTLQKDGTNYNSDKFLFVTASHTNDKIIITTDDRLIRNGLNSIINQIDFKVYPLKDFLKEY